MKYKHFILEDRKTISPSISKKMKCIVIAEELDYNPASISKELKRNETECTCTRYPADVEYALLKRFSHNYISYDKNTTNIYAANLATKQKLLKKV